MKHEIHVDDDSPIPGLLSNNYCFLLHSLTGAFYIMFLTYIMSILHVSGTMADWLILL